MPTEEVPEIERRFLVDKIDPSVFDAPSIRIEQGYLADGMRIRITDGKTPILTRKTGRGLVRREFNRANTIGLEDGYFLLEGTEARLVKRRYKLDGWEVDVFEGVLEGLILAEIELPSADTLIELPSWLLEAQEVTDSLSNEHLAHLAQRLTATGNFSLPVQAHLPQTISRIVLTGCPCSGKSTALEALRAEFGDRIHCVPEVASIVISQVGIVPPPASDRLATHRFQREMSRLQLAFEDISEGEVLDRGMHALLLDRGLHDNAAYLEGGLQELDQILLGQLQRHQNRYSLVVVLAAPPEHVFDAMRANNPARRETYKEVVALDRRIREAYTHHPNRAIIDGASWEEKMHIIRYAILTELDRH